MGTGQGGGRLDHGFLYNHGTYTVLDVPGALDTYAQSINDKRAIAGDYLINSFLSTFAQNSITSG